MTKPTRDEILRQAHSLVVVDDGAYRWVGAQSEIYGWLNKHGFERDYTAGAGSSVEMTAEDYQSLCDSVDCISDTSGASGYLDCDPHDLIDDLLDRGAASLEIG